MIWYVWRPDSKVRGMDVQPWRKPTAVKAETKRAALIQYVRTLPYESLGWILYASEVLPRHAEEGYRYSVLPRITYDINGV